MADWRMTHLVAVNVDATNSPSPWLDAMTMSITREGYSGNIAFSEQQGENEGCSTGAQADAGQLDKSAEGQMAKVQLCKMRF
jgi:hypothetical protein